MSAAKSHKANYRAIKPLENDSIGDDGYDRKKGIHLNNLWSIWYGIICAGFQGYLAYKCLKEILGYSVLTWPNGLPYIELNCSLGLNGAVFLLLPIFFTVTILKVGNLANDGYKLGHQSSMCSREPADLLLNASNGSGCGLFRYGGPTAPFIHVAIAFCLLVPKLLMEAKMIRAGFLSQDYVWHTDLDFLVDQDAARNRSFVLSFRSAVVVNETENAAPPQVPLNLLLAEQFYEPQLTTMFNSANVTHTVIKTLKDIIGHEARSYADKDFGASWESTVSFEYINLIVALMIYSVRYPALFWSANKSLGLLFSFLLFLNGLHILVLFAGMSVLYKIHVANTWLLLPFLEHNFQKLSHGFGDATPFLLNAEVTIGLYVLSVLLVLASSVVLYFYGHTRFMAFVDLQRDTKLITLRDKSTDAWSYFTHCAAFSVIFSIAIANLPLVHDFQVVYRGCRDRIALLCTIYAIFHVFFWLIIWMFLVVKQRWTFKMRVSMGEAVIKETRSLRLVQSVQPSTSSGGESSSSGQPPPLLVIGNGITYTVSDGSPKRAIMDILHKSALVKKSKSNGSMATSDDTNEGVYWLRSARGGSSQLQGKSSYFSWFKRSKNKTQLLDEFSSTSANRPKSNTRNSIIPGIDDDDGDYATLRELPLAKGKKDRSDDSVDEKGKLLACVHDDNITYATANHDLTPPSNPILEPIVIHTNFVLQKQSSVATSERIQRADSGILAHEDLPGRSNSLSTDCSVSPPEPPGSSTSSGASESSSGVHSTESNETSLAKQVVRRAAPDGEAVVGGGGGTPESTVVIRRKSLRPNPNEGVAEAILKEDPYGRATNMRMTSFMDTKGPSSSATLPHYPTQPSVQTGYNNCSTMPLPQHTSANIPQSVIANGNSCNVFPNRPHTTIPTHLNGVKILPGNGVEIKNHKIEPIYTKINRGTNELCHYSTNRHS